MIILISERMSLSPEDAYMFSSLAVDMRVTQLVDGNKGIHAMLPKRYANGPN
jgi:acetamidase/formamidase